MKLPGKTLDPWRIHTAPTAINTTPSNAKTQRISLDITAIASEQLGKALTWLELLGADADGEVGDAKPMLAILDALRGDEFDEIVLCALPAGISRWLKMDLPSRVRSAFGLPVTHIVADLERQGVSR